MVAPCAGLIASVAIGFPDLVPPDRDARHPAGNSVVLDSDGLRVEIAHLREGSLEVGTGDEVRAGASLGRVGNSGNTTEPHLHVHPVDPTTGEGVPVTLDGKWPRRNRLWLSG